jgi:predicted protein tyrosine phosphatase
MTTSDIKKYKTIIIALVVVNLLTIFFWWFLGFGGFHKFSKEKEAENTKNFSAKVALEEKLGLDPDQKVLFEVHNKVHYTQLKEFNQSIDSLRRVLRDEVISGASDSIRVKELFEAIALQRTQMDLSIYHHFRELKAICKPEQKVVFDSVVNSFLLRKGRFHQSQTEREKRRD